MPRFSKRFPQAAKGGYVLSPAWQLAGLAALAVVLIAAGARIVLTGQHRSAADRERERRLLVAERGRLTDGMIMESGAGAIYYSYSVAGVRYRASQDISQLSPYLPASPERLAGPVTLKYAPDNPANSILICERWSGIRTAHKETISNECV